MLTRLVFDMSLGDGIRTEVNHSTPSGYCGETITPMLELAAESLKAKESSLYFMINWKSLKGLGPGKKERFSGRFHSDD